MCIRNGGKIETVAICLYFSKETPKGKPARDTGGEEQGRESRGGGTG